MSEFEVSASLPLSGLDLICFIIISHNLDHTKANLVLRPLPFWHYVAEWHSGHLWRQAYSLQINSSGCCDWLCKLPGHKGVAYLAQQPARSLRAEGCAGGAKNYLSVTQKQVGIKEMEHSKSFNKKTLIISVVVSLCIQSQCTEPLVIITCMCVTCACMSALWKNGIKH